MSSSSPTDSKVAVYSFRVFNQGFESPTVAPFKATRRAIVETFHGDPIESTEEWVPANELDESERYRRLPTGWGELGPR